MKISIKKRVQFERNFERSLLAFLATKCHLRFSNLNREGGEQLDLEGLQLSLSK